MRLRASISPPSRIEAGCDGWLMLDCPRKSVLTAPAVRRIPWSRQEHFRTGRHVARRLVGTEPSGWCYIFLVPIWDKGTESLCVGTAGLRCHHRHHLLREMVRCISQGACGL